MEAVIAHFRQGRHTVSENQMIVSVPGIKSREEAETLVKKEVVWKTPSGKEIKGTVMSAHGNSGAVRVRFESGMPGQAIGTKVEVK